MRSEAKDDPQKDEAGRSTQHVGIAARSEDRQVVGKHSRQRLQIPGNAGDGEELRHLDRRELKLLLQQELQRQERNALLGTQQGQDQKSRTDEQVMAVELSRQK